MKLRPEGLFLPRSYSLCHTRVRTDEQRAHTVTHTHTTHNTHTHTDTHTDTHTQLLKLLYMQRNPFSVVFAGLDEGDEGLVRCWSERNRTLFSPVGCLAFDLHF